LNLESNDEAPQKSALLLDDNLMSAVRVGGQLERAGFQVRTKGVLPSEGDAPELILINLGSRSLNGVAQIQASRARFPDSKILGFCGHTEIEIRKAAKAAGIGRIFTNEEAMLELAQLLKTS
jgi:ActR/RegA family two-component response regulator